MKPVMAVERKKKANEIIEELEENDFSSEDLEAYKPTTNEPEDLVVENEAYNLLEYIDLEWPSATVDIFDSKIFLGTSPSEVSKYCPEIIQIDLKYTNFKKLNFKKSQIIEPINKLRIHKYIFGVSDNYLSKWDQSNTLMKKIKGEYGFALYLDSDRVFVGTKYGYVEIYNYEFDLIHKFQIHKDSIESICIFNNLIFTGSRDHSLRISDISGNMIKELKGTSDINCLDVRNNKIAYGDDDGLIYLYDLTSDILETIEWHKSPISLVKWKDDDVFATGSDEQLCLWDTSLVDENNEYHKYLLFVHQGQRMFKDCCFEDNRIICTSEDGVCIFEPICFQDYCKDG